jgi:4-hydroxy-tetrahydrodipicolinate reductase
MKIALLGYGKMGKEIEKICFEKQYDIVARIDNEADWNTYSKEISLANVAIEFSTPTTAINNIQKCFALGIPIVVGTTAWHEHAEGLKSECLKNNNTLIFGSNFSIGVNLFFYMNEVFANLMNSYPDYQTKMEEIHHTQKLDAPSGTAISLANILIEHIDHLKDWKKGVSNENDILGIVSKRIDPTPGTHSITYSSNVDELELKHTAKSREGFARGAIFAAEWIKDKKGWFEFKDILFNKS